MERVLRQPNLSEVDALFSQAFGGIQGPEGKVVFFPVRHHSPACAYNLWKVIDLYKPEAILIEGPADATALIPYLSPETATPPVCIYYSYDDKEGLAGEEREKYRAYYPFLAYSPEWVALSRAKALQIPASFIDLPYGARLVNGGLEKTAQYSYNEDWEYEVNTYTAMVAKRAGCRCFGEFWESQYELNVRQRTSAEFVRSVLALGYFMRQATPVEDWESQDSLREWYMAREIERASKLHKRVLVVTGAFHVPGLLDLLKQEVGERTLKPHAQADVALYVMPYTFRDADSRQGYSAGMPFPAFYQTVWESLLREVSQKSRSDSKKKCSAEEPPYGKVILEYIVKTARYARGTQLVSLPDEINALVAARSLAALRGKEAPGVYELLDGVRSAFVKGDINNTATFELDFLYRLLSGMGAGKVTTRSCVPPVVLEFRAACQKFRLKADTVERQEVVLDLVKNPRHYEKSRFLHQLLFLETGFSQLLSGPDYANGRNRNLVRETWICHYSVQTETRLMDLSVFGATLSQVCASLLRQRFRDSMTAEELGKLLISVEVMGVEGFYSQYCEDIYSIAAGERSFVSLCKLLGSLSYLANMQRLMDGGVQEALPGFMEQVFRWAVERLPAVRRVTATEEQETCEQLLNLYSFSREQPDWCDDPFFGTQIEESLEDGFCNSRFYGLCLAIHHKRGNLSQDVFCERISAWLETSMEQPQEAASFIAGVFLAARDVLFADPEILTSLNGIVAGMDATRFLEVVPNLRYAFTVFLPGELERLGKMIAQLYGASEAKLSGSMNITAVELARGIRLDSLAREQLTEWGLICLADCPGLNSATPNQHNSQERNGYKNDGSLASDSGGFRPGGVTLESQ